MKKFMKNHGIMVLFAMAAVLLACSAIGSTRAALTYFSENYTAQVEMYDIGVTLVETSAQGSKDVSTRDYTGSDDQWDEDQGALLEDMLAESGDRLVIGKSYTERLSAKNSGNIDEYVRMRVYRYWTEGSDSDAKNTGLAPDLIKLELAQSDWIYDESASTEECMVFYWPHILAVGSETSPVSETLAIDSALSEKVTEESTSADGLTTTTTKYKYNGVQFNLEADVDAVQTHNAAEAIKSAWGVDVNVAEDGTISLR